MIVPSGESWDSQASWICLSAGPWSGRVSPDLRPGVFPSCAHSSTEETPQSWEWTEGASSAGF